MKSFTIRKGAALTLIAILAGTLADGTVHAEGQTATYQAIDKAANIDKIHIEISFQFDNFNKICRLK
ncbi:hypothetical protein ABFY57_18420 [Paenibacillus polymyxa]|uniref:hypothetical protein n=1 Tax=Paenibacillus polymyxa TaxID=1406 RepID=UPI003D285CEA